MPVPTPTSTGKTQSSIAITCDAPTGLTGPLTYQYERVQGAGLFTPGPVVVTPSDGGAGGSFTPTSLTFQPNGANPPAAQTVTYTPASAGDKTLSFVDNQGLADPTGMLYQAYTPLTAPVLQPATDVTSSSVALAWSASTGGVPPREYLVEFRRSGDIVWNDFLPPVVVFSDVVTGLDGNTTYEFRVRVSGAVGNFTDSNIVTATTLASGLCSILFRGRNGDSGLVAGCNVTARIAGYPQAVSDALLTQQITEGETDSSGITYLRLEQGVDYWVVATGPDGRTMARQKITVPIADTANFWELVS